MLVISDQWKATINIIIAGLPALGSVLLVLNESKKRKFKTSEMVGIYCIFWGFLLYASWENFQLPFNQSNPFLWYYGWIVGLVLALAATIWTIIATKRSKN
jgi:prolipoprotein diacylglyceryltransferase